MGFVEAINVIETSLPLVVLVQYIFTQPYHRRRLTSNKIVGFSCTSANHPNWLLMKYGKTTANSTIFHVFRHICAWTTFCYFYQSSHWHKSLQTHTQMLFCFAFSRKKKCNFDHSYFKCVILRISYKKALRFNAAGSVASMIMFCFSSLWSMFMRVIAQNCNRNPQTICFLLYLYNVHTNVYEAVEVYSLLNHCVIGLQLHKALFNYSSFHFRCTKYLFCALQHDSILVVVSCSMLSLNKIWSKMIFHKCDWSLYPIESE